MRFHIEDQHPPRITPAHTKILRQNKRNCDWLDKIGFRWIPHDTKWERQFLELEAFAKRHKRLPVNKQERHSEYLLSAWYFVQKKLARRGQPVS